MSDREEAITSLNKAWDVLGSQGIIEALVNVGISKAGCEEYCGNYGNCGGYCKPMGAALIPGQEVTSPAEVAAEIRMPFSS